MNIQGTAQAAADEGGPPGDLPVTVDRLPTPCLILDLDALDRNLATMAALTRHHGIALRPHAKVHKSSAIARRQLAGGAVGQCCATLGEAEALAAVKIPGLLITSPVVAPAMIERLLSLQTGDGPTVVIDDPENCAALAAAASQCGKRLPVVIDIDVGQRRTGAPSIGEAVALARAAASSTSLHYRGIQAYWGQLQGIAGYAERAAAVRDRGAYLSAVLETLGREGLPPEIVTGGGTGTSHLDAELGLFTEMQPGSYAFMDNFYADPRLWREGSAPYDCALFVRCHVVSANHAGQIIVNAGTKAFGSDAEPPHLPSELPLEASFRFMGDEHAAIDYPESGHCPLKPGGAVQFVPNYGAQAVSLYSNYFGIRGDRVVEILAVDARGR